MHKWSYSTKNITKFPHSKVKFKIIPWRCAWKFTNEIQDDMIRVLNTNVMLSSASINATTNALKRNIVLKVQAINILYICRSFTL
jgi:hypothetical protein